MTYSRNHSVSNNLEMTATSTTATPTPAASAANTKAHLLNASHGKHEHKTPSTRPKNTMREHSNSIASSTNSNELSQATLTSSPIGTFMSSGASISSNNSTHSSNNSGISSFKSSVNNSGGGSNGSNGSNDGYYSSGRNQRNRQQHHKRKEQQQQGVDNGGTFFANNNPYYNVQMSAGKRSGNGNKQHIRSSQVQSQQSPITAAHGVTNNSLRKSHSKRSSPFPAAGGGSMGKMSPLAVPTAETHFASSKCFDSPAPAALPKPPKHWTTTTTPSTPINNAKNAEEGGGGRSHRIKTTTSSAISSAESLDNLKAANLNVNSISKRMDENRRSVAFTSGITTPNSSSNNNSNSSGNDKQQQPHIYAGHVIKSSKRSLLDEFETLNLKMLLKVQN